MLQRNTLSLTAPLAIGFASVAAAQVPQPTQVTPRPGNVLLIVADDLGIDMVQTYAAHPDAAPTPTLDALVTNGVLFRNAYSDPTCSPTRAGILTGRYGCRTLVGQPIREYLPEFSLQQGELTLAEALRDLSPLAIETAAIGKWHLGSVVNGDALHPTLQGFDSFTGTLGNFRFGENYDRYRKVVDGGVTENSKYATTEQVDDAIDRIGTMQEPWFTYVAFNAPHQPFHAPPAHLHTYTLAGDPEADPKTHYRAAVQALDAELGRLLASIDPGVRQRTTVIFVGDNGSPNEAVTPPSIPGQAKGTFYEGGVHVPLIVSGSRIREPGRECDALVSTVDLFPTVIELFGLDLGAPAFQPGVIDGVSAVPYLRHPNQAPLRQFVVAERFGPNGPGPYYTAGRMIRDARWKLMERPGSADQFFDLDGAAESLDLISAGAMGFEEQVAYSRLKGWLKSTFDS